MRTDLECGGGGGDGEIPLISGGSISAKEVFIFALLPFLGSGTIYLLDKLAKVCCAERVSNRRVRIRGEK